MCFNDESFFKYDIKLQNARVLLVPVTLEYKESLKKIVFDEIIGNI